MPFVLEIVLQGPVEMDVAFRGWRWRSRLVPSLTFLDGLNDFFRDGDSACSGILVVVRHFLIREALAV